MKKTIILSIALVFAFSITKAQTIPNSSFESWTNVGNYENPDGWSTMNNTTANDNVFTATKASPGAEGSYYLKLVSKTVGSSVVNGIAVSGLMDSITLQPISGFSFNSRPSNLTGKWQHMISGSSQGLIQVTLTRWDSISNVRIPVASGIKNLSGMAMSWANFSIPLTYTDGNYPDTCIIVMQASGSHPTDNDYLYVDKLAFTGDVPVSGLRDIELNGINLSLYPNPASEFINLNFSSLELQDYKIELTNILGKTIKSEILKQVQGDVSCKLDLNNIPQGVYLVSLKTKSSVITRKISIL